MKNFSKLTLAAVLFVAAVNATEAPKVEATGVFSKVKSAFVAAPAKVKDAAVAAKNAVVAAPGAVKNAAVAGYNAVTLENAKAVAKFPFQLKNWNLDNARTAALVAVVGYVAFKAVKEVKARCGNCCTSKK